LSKKKSCPSCGHELEWGLNECPGCGDMAPLLISLDPQSLIRQAGRILLIIAVGMVLKLFLIG
jgi:hypothetical protein